MQPFRREVVLATKFHLITEEALEAGVSQTVRSHLAKSLERLQTDYVDLYYLHRLNRDVPVAEVAEAMGQLIREGLIRGWGLSQVSAATIAEAHQVCPLAAVQNIYSLVERSIEQEVIPCCLERGIGVVPFFPVASGFLSGRVTAETDFSHRDDVRKFVPQLKAENILANQPLLELIRRFADARGATMAQISLAWMLHKYPHVVPIPGSKNQERILENLGSWNVELSDQEFAELESCLSRIPVAGFRGHVEMQGGTMKDWGRKPENS